MAQNLLCICTSLLSCSVADAEHMPQFESGSFDVVTCFLGLMFFPGTWLGHTLHTLVRYVVLCTLPIDAMCGTTNMEVCRKVCV